jgi:hypothetical protein
VQKKKKKSGWGQEAVWRQEERSRGRVEAGREEQRQGEAGGEEQRPGGGRKRGKDAGEAGKDEGRQGGGRRSVGEAVWRQEERKREKGSGGARRRGREEGWRQGV